MNVNLNLAAMCECVVLKGLTYPDMGEGVSLLCWREVTSTVRVELFGDLCEYMYASRGELCR